MDSNYTKIFSGNAMMANLINEKLQEIGIEAIVKDEADSGRLAGFATTTMGLVDMYVHKDEISKASTIVEALEISSKN